MKTPVIALINTIILFSLLSGCTDIDPDPLTTDEINKQSNIEYLETFSKEFSSHFPKSEEIEMMNFLDAEQKQYFRKLDNFFEKTVRINPNISTADFSGLVNEIDGYVPGLNLRTELAKSSPNSPRDVLYGHLARNCPLPDLAICQRFPPLSVQWLFCMQRRMEVYLNCLKNVNRPPVSPQRGLKQVN